MSWAAEYQTNQVVALRVDSEPSSKILCESIGQEGLLGLKNTLLDINIPRNESFSEHHQSIFILHFDDTQMTDGRNIWNGPDIQASDIRFSITRCS